VNHTIWSHPLQNDCRYATLAPIEPDIQPYVQQLRTLACNKVQDDLRWAGRMDVCKPGNVLKLNCSTFDPESQMLYVHRDAQQHIGNSSNSTVIIPQLTCVYGEMGGTLKPIITQVTYAGDWQLVGSCVFGLTTI